MRFEEVLAKAKDANGNITEESIKKVIEDNKVNLVDLSEDGYVSKNKYSSELKAKADEIETLNNTIKTRDTDLATLKTQLENAGTDSDKLTALQGDLSQLQTKYDADVKAYKEQLAKQAYEFAVREFASTKKFTSTAAKRDFERSMIAKNLTMENDKILGAEDFVTAYTADNADAFVVEKKEEDKDGKGVPPVQAPQFVAPTGNTQVTNDNVNPFANAFSNFIGVRPREQK